MAHEEGKSVEDVVESGPGLAFQVYPAAVLKLPGSSFWAVMFFSMLLTLGLDSMFGTVEGILTVLDDMKLLPMRKELVTTTVCTFSFVCGIIFTCQAGVYYFELFDMFSAGVPLMVRELGILRRDMLPCLLLHPISASELTLLTSRIGNFCY